MARRSRPESAPVPGDVLDPRNDVIAAGPPQRSVTPTDEVVHRATGARGTVEKWHRDWVVLRLRGGSTRRVNNLAGGFSMHGETFSLTGVSRTPTSTAVRRTASGSIAAPDSGAKVARASRLWVEGDHDARLIERVWGDDLRDAAIVVEPLGGIDDLDAAVARFGPGPQARLAVLVDHLVPGTKEWRLTENQRSGPRDTTCARPSGSASRKPNTTDAAQIAMVILKPFQNFGRYWGSQPHCSPVTIA